MPLNPSVETHVIDGHLVAEFWDCLRMDAAPILKLQGLYDGHLRQGGKAGLVLDLQGVEFIGSAVLGGILRLHRTVGKNDARLVLCNVDPTVRDAFLVSHVENMFLYFDDRESALRHFTHNGSTTTAKPQASPQAELDKPRAAVRPGGPLSARRRASGSGQ